MIVFSKRIDSFWLKIGIHRGYLTFSVYDRYLFHRMNTKSSIFTSGGATSENITFDVHE